MRFKYHIDGSPTFRFGDIGQNLTPDRTQRETPGEPLLPPLGSPRGESPLPRGGILYISRAVFAACIAVTDDVY